MKKILTVVLAIFFLVVITDSCAGEADLGSYFDWGDGYYWNSSTHSVEESLW